MKRQSRAIGFALLAVLFWSTAGSAFKISLRYTEPLPLLLVSVTVAVMLLFIMNMLSSGLRMAFALKPWEYATSALMGFLNPFLYYAVLFEAYDRLYAQEAVVINYLWPVVLVLLSIPVLKQRIAWYQVMGILVSFAGTAVIATGGNFSSFEFRDPLGIALAGGSALIWAVYWLLNLRDKRENLPKLLLNFLFGLFFIIIWSLIRETPIRLPTELLLGGTYIGFFEMGLTFAIWLQALRLSSDTAKVSNLIFLSPFLSLIWVWTTVGEAIFQSTVWGLLLILAGIALQRQRNPQSGK